MDTEVVLRTPLEMADEYAIATERERLFALEVALDGLRRLLDEQRSADRTAHELALRQLQSQVLTMASAHDRFALATGLEKLEARLEALEAAVAGMRTVLVPRNEMQARFEGVAGKQEAITSAVAGVDRALQKLSDEWSIQVRQNKDYEEKADKRRNNTVAKISVLVAAVGVAVVLFFDLHSKPAPIIVQVPGVTATTLPSAPGTTK